MSFYIVYLENGKKATKKFLKIEENKKIFSENFVLMEINRKYFCKNVILQKNQSQNPQRTGRKISGVFSYKISKSFLGVLVKTA